MSELSVIHNTFVIERNYPASPERVFSAFADPAKKRRWLLEGGGHQVERFEMKFEAGGREFTRFRVKEGSPVEGAIFTTESTYYNIVPNQRIVFSSAMAMNGNSISAALITVELVAAESGTDVVFTHQAAFFEGSDGPAMREGGWRTLLDRLAAEIPQE